MHSIDSRQRRILVGTESPATELRLTGQLVERMKVVTEGRGEHT